MAGKEMKQTWDGVSVWLKEFACGPSEWLVNFSEAPAVARARRELDY